MLFHSYVFLYFFFATLLLHELLPQPAKRYLLLAASLVFYGAWNAKYLLLLLATTLIDYYAAKWIADSADPRKRKLLLVLSMSTNLGMLAVFKYYNFFAHSFDELFSWQLPLHSLLLPVGISFYTFQTMSYTIDVYRRELPPAKDFTDFLLFVSFFPQLVAGPIVRAADFLPQLEAAHRPRSLESLRLGLKLFAVGFFRKVVVADNLATFVDAVHRDPAAHGAADLWISAYAFAFQIYYDFAGYSDMAIGLALFFGFRFPENFRRPYMAVNISDFWRRWHISLSTWLRDYLYIPLGGNRGGSFATYRNLVLTMALGGLWHGANWTFLAWGFFHGAALGIHRLFRELAVRRPALDRLTRSGLFTAGSILLTFHCWTLSMVLFRAQTIHVAGDMLRRMISGAGPAAVTGLPFLALCGLLYLVQAINEKQDLLFAFDRWPLAVRSLVAAGIVWAAILLAPQNAAPFLYFQF